MFRIGGNHLVDNGFNRTRIGDLFQAVFFDNISRVAFPIDHALEDILRNLAGNDFTSDQVDQAAELDRGYRRFRKLQFGLVEIAEQFLCDPVRRELGIAPFGNRLIEICALGISGQHTGIIARQAIVDLKPRAFLVWQFRQVDPNAFNERIINFQRQQVGVGEIAVIMRILFRSHAAGLALVRIIKAGFLIDRATALENFDLAARFELNRRLDEAKRVHVLDLAAGAEFAKIAGFAKLLIGAGFAHRDVHICAQVALLHVPVAGAERDDDGFELFHIGGGFKRRSNIRLGDDFHQRDPGTIEIHIGR